MALKPARQGMRIQGWGLPMPGQSTVQRRRVLLQSSAEEGIVLQSSIDQHRTLQSNTEHYGAMQSSAEYCRAKLDDHVVQRTSEQLKGFSGEG